MFKLTGVKVAVGFLTQLLVGCGNKTEPGPGTLPAGTQQVTIYVAGMCDTLGIFCPD